VFFGWKIVFLAFVVAFFAFGTRSYRVGIYLVAGPLGAVRDWTGSYTAALAVCVGCEVVAAVVILLGRRR